MMIGQASNIEVFENSPLGWASSQVLQPAAPIERVTGEPLLSNASVRATQATAPFLGTLNEAD